MGAIASQNAATIKNMRLGMLISGVLALALRMIFQRSSLSPKTLAFWIYCLSLVPSIFLTRYLERIGSPRHDPTTGTLISSGEDLARPGILEWCFDVVYITCKSAVFLPELWKFNGLREGACQVGSGLLGTWVWWFYLVVSTCHVFEAFPYAALHQIPGYAVFKLWGGVISPMLLGRGGPSPAEEDAAPAAPTSKRQEKLRKRSERGDPRVQTRSK